MLWLPLIGPILQGLFTTAGTLYTKYKDTELGKLQTNRTNDLEEAKVGAAIVTNNQEYIGLRILTDLALLPPIVWGGIIGWDTIVAYRYPGLMFHVPDYPVGVQYIPYGAYAFLFGVLGMNIWKRK